MDDKTEVLISLGAATAANCVSCFEYYFKKATDTGLRSSEIEKAVEIGNKVKTGASIAMKRSIRDITGCDGEADQQAGTTTDHHPCCH
jgi:alkylhydroperoxidase/carboxymuconolactone decarboxylase family protein YurZ